MSDVSNIEHQRQTILNAESKGGLTKWGAYTRLSGPGWLQSAITLGGGSLSSSLFLGMLGGFSLLWVQPLAMILGVVMLSAISYVTLSTSKHPFKMVNQHFNPVVGWAWIIATLLANVVWVLPQYNLGTTVALNNLFPDSLGAMEGSTGKYIVAGGILLFTTVVVWFYDRGSKGISYAESILKIIVALIVLAFVGVVVQMTLSGDLHWPAVLKGLIPDFSLLFTSAAGFDSALAAIESEPARGFWRNEIITMQQNSIIAGLAYAVGINMTFLLPYSMLAKGWDKDFRSLAKFDLMTGLLIPFILATSCIVIAAASQFHAKTPAGLLGELDASGNPIVVSVGIQSKFNSSLIKRIQFDHKGQIYEQITNTQQQMADLSVSERRMAAMLVKRGPVDLSASLAPLVGSKVANLIFGFGVFSMAVSTIIVLMLINGFVLCEMLGVPCRGWPHKIGCMMPCVGVLGPFVWSGDTAFYLAVTTATLGLITLPVAYLSFFVLMNKSEVLGDEKLKGTRKACWNFLMVLSLILITLGSVWAVKLKGGLTGVYVLLAFVVLAAIVHVTKKRRVLINDSGEE